MAIRKSNYGAKKQQSEATDKKCRDCAHSYDWQNRSFYDGHLILCRCKFDAQSKHGQFCKFLSDPACGQFKQRKEATDEQV